METQEKIVNRYVEKPVKTKNGFAMLALILLLFFGSIAAMVCGPVFLSATNVGAAVAIAIAGALVLIFDLILSRLVDTFISRISLTMLPVPNPHNTVCVLSWEEARHWQSRSSGYSSS